MTEQITARQFHFSGGVTDWRVTDGGACAYFRTGSFATGARFVHAMSEIPTWTITHPTSICVQLVSSCACSPPPRLRAG